MKENLKLKQSAVLFDREKHEYWLPNKEDGTLTSLSGITSLIEKHLGSGYENVPKPILKAAAEYGSKIHEVIELYTMLGIKDNSVELTDFISLCEKEDVKVELSEYLVSDNKHYASSIDLVARVSANVFDLFDLKTYHDFNEDKLLRVRFQLSIYRRFFLMMNPGSKVRRLGVIIIRNKQKKSGEYDHKVHFQEIEPIPDEILDDLFEADHKGEIFNNPFSVPEEIISKVSSIKSLLQIKKNTEEKLEILKKEVLEKMEQSQIRRWITEDASVTRKLPTTRTSFSLADFKKANPDINIEPYMKVSNVAGCLLISA